MTNIISPPSVEQLIDNKISVENFLVLAESLSSGFIKRLLFAFNSKLVGYIQLLEPFADPTGCQKAITLLSCAVPIVSLVLFLRQSETDDHEINAIMTDISNGGASAQLESTIAMNP